MTRPVWIKPEEVYMTCPCCGQQTLRVYIWGSAEDPVVSWECQNEDCVVWMKTTNAAKLFEKREAFEAVAK